MTERKVTVVGYLFIKHFIAQTDPDQSLFKQTMGLYSSSGVPPRTGGGVRSGGGGRGHLRRGARRAEAAVRAARDNAQ